MKIVPAGREPQRMPEIDDCDVIDRTALSEYRAKREEWLGWYELRADEPNSIQQQIFSMMFLDIAYRVLALPRRNAGKDLQISARSGLLAHILDQGYVANQVLAIRRLLDRRRDVISLRRLFDDILDHKNLLTREVYTSYDGTPYNPDLWKELPQDTMTQIWGIQAPGLSNYQRAQYRHEKFDCLSGVSASERRRSDLIKDSVFDRLKQWLETTTADKFIKLSHKFFAHAANMDSRGALDYSGIQLADVAEVHRSIIRVERAITDELLYIGVAREVVPRPPLGLLQGLDSPYVAAELIANMQEHWDQLSNERNNWPRGITDEMQR